MFDAWRGGRLHDAVPASAAPRKPETSAPAFLRSEARRNARKGQTPIAAESLDWQ
jgi:hypothetical protein